jgi:DNA polymerase III, subunit gamma and tau
MYHALYRKYRPMTFDDVVGQDSIVTTLRNSIINKTFSHAYMFFGPRGTGKTTISKIFARSINCEEPIDGCTCGKCPKCLHSFEKECVDIIEIDAASNNGVDEIRELKNKISLVPAELKYKVYIIDEVHMLSIGAFNALLKTLEEPPEHAIFILATTDPQKVPETIISRCQCFSFKRISENAIVDRMKFIAENENISIEADVLHDIAKFSDGGMRDALGLLDKLSSYTDKKITSDSFAELNGTITKGDLEKFVDNIFSNNIGEILTYIVDINNSGKNLIQVIIQLLDYLQDTLFSYYVNNVELKYPVNKIISLANVINDKLFDIKKSSNPRIYIEMLLIDFCEKNKNFNSVEIISREIIPNKKLTNNSIKDSQTIVRTENHAKNDTVVIDTNVKKDNDSSDKITINKEFSPSIDKKVILNLNDIMKARVNNIMATADKSILKDVIDKMPIFNDYTFDSEIGFVACALLDTKVRAASNIGIILSYEYDSIVKQNLLNLEKINEVYNKLNKTNYKLAIISDLEWDKAKSDYIKTIKSGGSYSLIEEPAPELFEDTKKDDIISNSAVELFGDIVEID